MKVLFIGGIKSGKSLNAEKFITKEAKRKPAYLATTEFIDDEMHLKIQQHKLQREDAFVTLEEPIEIYKSIENYEGCVLVECLSMWINNMMFHNYSYSHMERELLKIMRLEKEIVFVINDVGSGVISANKLAREFVDINGKLSQIVAANCDRVYHTIAGISTRIK